MALPSNVTFGTVIGRLLIAIGDTNTDTDRDPDGIAPTGLTITFTPLLASAIAVDVTASPPAMFALSDVTATVGPDGTLVGPDGISGIRLVAPNNAALQPNGWKWKAIISGPAFPKIEIPFTLDPGGTLDLALALAATFAPSTPTVSPVANTVAPAISGTAVTGSTLTASSGTWTPIPDRFAYQWLRAGSPIASAIAATYTLTSGDVGQGIACAVTASKTGYADASATSSAIIPTAPAGSGSTLATVGSAVVGTSTIAA